MLENLWTEFKKLNIFQEKKKYIMVIEQWMREMFSYIWINFFFYKIVSRHFEKETCLSSLYETSWAKTFWTQYFLPNQSLMAKTSIKHLLDTFMLDQYLTDIDPRVFVIWE